jgi:hypothetical protein
MVFLGSSLLSPLVKKLQLPHHNLHLHDKAECRLTPNCTVYFIDNYLDPDSHTLEPATCSAEMNSAVNAYPDGVPCSICASLQRIQLSTDVLGRVGKLIFTAGKGALRESNRNNCMCAIFWRICERMEATDIDFITTWSCQSDTGLEFRMCLNKFNQPSRARWLSMALDKGLGKTSNFPPTHPANHC